MGIKFYLLAIIATLPFSCFSQTNNLGDLGISGFKQETIDSECKWITTFGDTAILNEFKIYLDDQKFKICTKSGESSIETENGVWKFTIRGINKFEMVLHDSTYSIDTQKEYYVLPPLVKTKINLMAILLNNFLTIDQAETSPNIQARLCGAWHTSTLGITSVEATLDNSVEAAEFGSDNPNCKWVGQVMSCWGDQHICVATTIWHCSCRYFSIPFLGIGL